MAGILNSKERMIDFLITEEGKRQATSGQMKIEYATFTDMHTFYASSGSSQPDVAEDASNRIYFEATNRFQDVVVPELLPGNSLKPFRTTDFEFSGNIIASGTFRKGFQKRFTEVTGSKLQDDAVRTLDGITQNFNDLRILATEDPFAMTTGFRLNTTTGSFVIWDEMPTSKSPDGKITLEAAPSLFADERFTHFPNFSFLPPVNVTVAGTDQGVPLGEYPELTKSEVWTFQQFEQRIKHQQSVDIEFADTSRDNNLVGQMFEFTHEGVEKLSIIDFGEFEDEDPVSPGKHVFFVGKLYVDVNGTETFMNIFTVVFD